MRMCFKNIFQVLCIYWCFIVEAANLLLSVLQLNKKFILSYLNVHGKLFTKIG